MGFDAARILRQYWGGGQRSSEQAGKYGCTEHAETLADELADGAAECCRAGTMKVETTFLEQEQEQVAQRTFSIIKPDAVRKGYTGAILAEIEKAGFQIIAIKKQSISKEEAKGILRSPRRAAVLRYL